MFRKVVEQIRARRTTLASIGALMSSQLLSAGLAAVGGLIQARFVLPNVLGYYSAFGIPAGYLTFLHMGSLTALQREYPYNLGKGDTQRARDVAAITQGWILVICGFLCAGYLAASVVCLALGWYRAAAGWASQLVIVSLFNYLLYLASTYRASHEFVTLAKIRVAGSAAAFMALPFVALWGFWGLCLRGVMPSIVSGLLTHKKRPVRVRPRLDFRQLWGMVKFGLPMDMAGFLATSCTLATMHAMVLRNHGELVLGLFAFARVAENIAEQLGQSINEVFLPRISHRMGVTESIGACARGCVRPALFGGLFMAGVAVAGGLLCRPVVRAVVPNYIDSVPMIQLLLWIGLYPVLLIPRSALIAAKKPWPVALGSTMAFIVFLGGSFGGLALGGGVTWIIVAYLASRVANVIVAYVFVWREVSLEKLSAGRTQVAPGSAGIGQEVL